jgi:uncharacterized damage-inducible protein DinB
VDPILATVIAELTKQHDHLKKTMEGASQEALDWKPGPDTNSLGVLAVHVAGAEKFWIGDLTTGRPSTRDRDAEFQVHGLPFAELVAALDGALEDSVATLSKLEGANLAENRYVERYNREQSVGTSILHALTHIALHVGHAQLTRQMYDQQHAR